MKKVQCRVEEELFRRVKVRALDSGVSLQEVLERLLLAFAEGKINVAARLPALVSRDAEVIGESVTEEMSTPVSAVSRDVSAGKTFVRAGCLVRVPQGVRCGVCGAVHQP